MATVGENIAKHRKLQGLSQVDLAERMGVRQPTVWKIEHAKGIPQGPTLLNVAKAIPCTVDQLLADVDEEYDRLRKIVSEGDEKRQSPPRQTNTDGEGHEQPRETPGKDFVKGSAAAGRDLTGQSRGVQQGSQQQGEPRASTDPSVPQLLAELDIHRGIIADAFTLASAVIDQLRAELADAAGRRPESREAPRTRTKRRGGR